ncbi:MAG: hypothetical protein IJP03_01780 [Christensenellaceae bacterium]|nr:hypothetical protein [Christensenellaceae bacterium]
MILVECAMGEKMPACTFFGHHDCPNAIKPKLREVLINLIVNHSVDMFYVGRQGAFDGIVRSVLKELMAAYPHIDYAVVLERLPQKRNGFDVHDYSDTILPEGIESVHPRFAISWRNNWMLKRSDYVVTYITRSEGGAAQFAEKAEHKNKTVINLV